MRVLLPVYVTTVMWLFSITGLGLMVRPARTLQLLDRIRMAGLYYDRERGSALPLWLWRLGGLFMFLLGAVYGTIAIVITLSRLER